MDAGSWANVTSANTLFEAVREAWDFYQTDFWRGPKPTLETIFEVSLVGDEREVAGDRTASGEHGDVFITST